MAPCIARGIGISITCHGLCAAGAHTLKELCHNPEGQQHLRLTQHTCKHASHPCISWHACNRLSVMWSAAEIYRDTVRIAGVNVSIGRRNHLAPRGAPRTCACTDDGPPRPAGTQGPDLALQNAPHRQRGSLQHAQGHQPVCARKAERPASDNLKFFKCNSNRLHHHGYTGAPIPLPPP